MSGLRPRLTATVKVERHVNRGTTWYVLSDTRGTRALRDAWRRFFSPSWRPVRMQQFLKP